MKNIHLVSLLVIISACQTTDDRKSTADALPNIIHVFADDLGYGDLSCFGAADISTPNIDRIASQGIRFTEFYSAAHVCSPSRAALLTGRYPQRMGIHGVFFPESFTGMPTEEVTIAEMLRPLGYKNGVVGKWHLGHRHQFLPLQQGFDSYYGIPYSNDMTSVVYMKDNEVDSFSVDQRYTTRTYTTKALEFIEQNKKNPFFLYIPHSMPHVPIYASEPFIGTSGRGLYGDVIQELDWSVGEILNKLEDLALLDNTLVIFSSDNGPWLVMEEHGGSAGVLREGKQFTFEGGMRVPTVAMWPDKIPKGQVYEGLATQMDWFPTLARLTGAELPVGRKIDGLDISEVLFGTGERENEEFIYFDGGKPEAYRSGRWKVKLPYDGFQGARWKQAVAAHDTLLIDLASNPSESNNLHHAHEEKAHQLLSEMTTTYHELGELPEPLVLRSAADESHYDFLKSKGLE